MLQFWKRNGVKDGSHSNKNSPSKATGSSSPSLSNGDISQEVLHTGPLSCYSECELSVGDLGESNQRTKGNNSSHSRLSKTLAEVLADKGALVYFIQYLESRGCVALIKFWLDAEIFRSASSAEIRCSEDVPDVSVSREVLEAECSNCKHSPFHEEQNVVSLRTDSRYSVDGPESGDAANIALKGRTHSLEVSNTSSLYVSLDINYESHCQMAICSSEVSHKSLSRLKDCGESYSDMSDVSNCSANKCICVATNIDSTTSVNHYQSLNVGTCRENTSESDVRRLTMRPCDTVSPVYQTASPTRAVKLIEGTLHDAARIFRKYFIHSARYRIRPPEEVRNRMISAICKDNGIIETDCFNECQDLVFHIMERDFFDDFLRSDYHCKHQIDVLTSGTVLLADILYNDNALFYFTEFMEQEGNQSLVEFWLAAVNFCQHLLEKKGIYDAAEAQNDAIILYDRYFSLQATCPLGFSDKIRFEIEQNICREDGPLSDCFEKPVRIVLHVLEKNYLQPFLSSQLFFNYLSELINTIQSSSSLLSRSRKSGSECSSEVSLSAHNTLLATEDNSSTPRKIICKLNDKQMSIDSRQLYDPDSLWRRRRHRDLSFGRITGLGRYESDVEPEPDKKEESRLARVVKKLVNMEEDKAKEELAWQIAEMIVKDVTSLTMGSEEDQP